MSTPPLWALVLAAGSGNRLRDLTTTGAGTAIPKQFCTLQTGDSLLQETLTRAESVTARRRVMCVVASEHRRWWEVALWPLPPMNVIVQPENKGTAIGLLLSLLHLELRQPDARVVILPSDHYVASEGLLSQSLRRAARIAAIDGKAIVLLGVEPEEADPELGYILPTRQELGASQVLRFIEKPGISAARRLIDAGALWNVFIIAASVSALLSLYQHRWPALLNRLRAAVAKDAADPRSPLATAAIYSDLVSLDFSRDVIQGQESALRVLRVPSCGWSDLGTPQRVTRTLEGLKTHAEPLFADMPRTGYLSLAAQVRSMENR